MRDRERATEIQGGKVRAIPKKKVQQKEYPALVRWLSWWEHRPINQKITGSISGQDIYIYVADWILGRGV